METSNLKILIVEDEALVAAGISACLSELNHQTIGIASSGSEALTFIEQNMPDLILMDINLPEIDGITALSIINKQYKIPCIFITGYADEETIARAQSAYTFGYLVKPVDADDLRAAINTSVARYNEYVRVNQNLQQTQKALEDRKIIERAKGILMDYLGMREGQAMQHLQKKSRTTNMKIADVARKIIAIYEKDT